jgi:hypothetical protein
MSKTWLLDEVLPAALHDAEVHANPLETDHGRLKADYVLPHDEGSARAGARAP